MALISQGFTQVANRTDLPSLPQSGNPEQKFYFSLDTGFYFTGGSSGSARGTIYINGASYVYRGGFTVRVHGSSFGTDTYVCTGIVYLPVNNLSGQPGRVAIAFNVAYSVSNNIATPVTPVPLILPVMYQQNSGNLMSSFDMYPISARRSQLDDRFLDLSTAGSVDVTSQCVVAKRIAQGRTFGNDSGTVFNVTLSLPNEVDAWRNLSTYDYDNGGEIDIYEWASNRNRMDASDDSPNCNESLPSESEEVKASQVEVGPETREKYRNNQETAITAAVGDNSYISDPTIENFYITPPSYSPANGLDKIDEFQSAVESKLSSQDNYQKLQALIQPLGSDNLPSYSLPDVSVSLGTGRRSGSSSVSIDLSDVKLDFGAIQQNSDVWQILVLGRNILACAIFFFTSWRIWKLFASLLSTGSLGSESSNDD